MGRLLGILATVLLVAPVSFAQTSDQVELTRTVIEAERKAIVASNMNLPEAESANFWPVYNDYERDLRATSDRLLNIIKLFSQDYQILTDAQAEAIVEEYLDLRRDRLKLRASYLKKFRRVLDHKEVMRFYQIENKLQAISDYDLAQAIPLAR